MRTRGFTLIELMVSVTIFIIVMTVSLGALLAMSASDRKAESVKTIMNNLSFAMESMTRTIRTGYTYGCGTGTPPNNCNPTASPRLNLTAPVGSTPTTVTYCLGSVSTGACSGTTNCTVAAGCSIMRRVGGGNLEPLTAPEVEVENLAFYVQGALSGDNTQPRVIITLDGSVITTDLASTTSFELQTTVTQRLYDQ